MRGRGPTGRICLLGCIVAPVSKSGPRDRLKDERNRSWTETGGECRRIVQGARLGRIAEVVEEQTKEDIMGAKGEAFATQFESKVEEATALLEKLNDAAWYQTT